MKIKSELILKNLHYFLKGIGQIMLQNNAWTGLFFLAGIFWGSFTMGLATVLAVATGTCTAKMLKFNEEEIQSGLYGFSAALVGVALICFFKASPLVWFSVILGSFLATLIQHKFIVRQIPVFTFPFILITWIVLALNHFCPSFYAPLEITENNLLPSYLPEKLGFISRSFGQVIFQENLFSGFLFILGIFFSSPLGAIYALFSALLAGFFAWQLGEPQVDVNMGLLSFNAVLCALTFAGKKVENIFMSLSSAVLSVLIMIKMREFGVPALTFPFVLACWLVLGFKEIWRKIIVKV